MNPKNEIKKSIDTSKDAKGDGLDPQETGGLDCRPTASGGVQPLAENSILAYCQV